MKRYFFVDRDESDRSSQSDFGEPTLTSGVVIYVGRIYEEISVGPTREINSPSECKHVGRKRLTGRATALARGVGA